MRQHTLPVLLALAAFVAPASAAERRPNIVVILADDFGVGEGTRLTVAVGEGPAVRVDVGVRVFTGLQGTTDRSSMKVAGGLTCAPGRTEGS